MKKKQYNNTGYRNRYLRHVLCVCGFFSDNRVGSSINGLGAYDDSKRTVGLTGYD